MPKQKRLHNKQDQINVNKKPLFGGFLFLSLFIALDLYNIPTIYLRRL